MSIFQKLRIKKLIFVICIFCISLMSNVFGQQDQEIIQSNVIKIEYNFEMPEIKPIDSYVSITIPGLENAGNPGEPVLPFKTAKILLPYGVDYKKVKISYGEKILLASDCLIKSAQELVPISEGVQQTLPDKNIYNILTSSPQKLYNDVMVQNKKGFKILILNLFPVEYIPKKGQINYYQNLTVNVYTKPINKQKNKIIQLLREPEESDKEIILNMVDNPNLITSYFDTSMQVENDSSNVKIQSKLDSTSSYDYVIITNESLENAFKRLINYRNHKGLKATLVTTEFIYANYLGVRPDGKIDNQTKIRDFITDAYNNWKTEYILLGGDMTIIPVRELCSDLKLKSTVPSDIYYACLEGTYDNNSNGVYGEPNDGLKGSEVDLMSEIYIGRAQIDTVEKVQDFVKNTIINENIINKDSFFKKALIVEKTSNELLSNKGYLKELKSHFPSDWSINTLDGNNLLSLNSDLNNAKNNSYNRYIVNQIEKIIEFKGKNLDNLSESTDAQSFDSVGMDSSDVFAYIGEFSEKSNKINSVDDKYFEKYSIEFVKNLFEETTKEKKLGEIYQKSKEKLTGCINNNKHSRLSIYSLNLMGDPGIFLTSSFDLGPVLYIDESCDFGQVQVPFSSLKYIFLCNDGDEILYIYSKFFSDPDNFSYISGPSSIPVNGASTIAAKFFPKTRNGTFYEWMSVNSNDVTEYVDLTGTAYGGTVFPSVYPILFGNVVVGETKTNRVAIRNQGSLELEIISEGIPISSQTGGKDHFAVDSNQSLTISPGGNGYIDVIFHPRDVGDQIRAELWIGYYNASGNLANYGPITLSGNGIAQPPPPQPFDITITNKTFTTNETIIATNSITAGPAVSAEPNVDVTFKAGNFIKLKPGFWAKLGSKFHAYIE